MPPDVISPKTILNYRQEYAAYRPGYIAATKLSNHDEDRAASKLGKSTAKEKLAAAVLLTTPGSPYIYYGEELGYTAPKTKEMNMYADLCCGETVIPPTIPTK